MARTRTFAHTWSAAIIVLAATAASGQNYPSKPVRIFTAEPGGGTDFASRLIAQGIAGTLGQPVTVENRPTVLSIDTVAKAPADGYTLLLQGNIIWFQPLLRGNLSYDPARDFAPVTLVATSPQILVVHPSLPVKTVKDLIALAKAKPGELNYSTGAVGVPSHLAGELLKAMAHINVVHVPYNGGGAAITALLSGEVQFSFSAAGAITPHLKSGRLRALAVTTVQPSSVFPGLPTMASSGLPGYDAATLYVLFAPANTPDAVVRRLNQETVRFLTTPDAKEQFLKFGLDTVGSSPEQLAAAVKSDTARMSKVIKDAGIRVE